MSYGLSCDQQALLREAVEAAWQQPRALRGARVAVWLEPAPKPPRVHRAPAPPREWWERWRLHALDHNRHTEFTLFMRDDGSLGLVELRCRHIQRKHLTLEPDQTP